MPVPLPAPGDSEGPVSPPNHAQPPLPCPRRAAVVANAPSSPVPVGGQQRLRGPGAPAGTDRCSPAWDIWPGLGGGGSGGLQRNRDHREGFGGTGAAARGLMHFVHPASPKSPCWPAGSPCSPGWGAQCGSHCPEHPIPCATAGGFPGSPAPSPRYRSRAVAVPPGCWRGARRHGPGSNRSSPNSCPALPGTAIPRQELESG